jgi:hypothetical protein
VAEEAKPTPAGCRAESGMHSGASVNAVTKSGTSPAVGLTEFVLDLATCGRITSMTGTPRIMQFGVKYGF